MQRCSEKAYAMCSTRHLCGSREEATFMVPSECADFNNSVEDKQMTNASPDMDCYEVSCVECVTNWLQQPAVRIIDAMALVTRLSRIVIGQKSARKVYDDILSCIAEAPTVDVVKIVRCKHCVSRRYDSINDEFLCDNERSCLIVVE